MVETSEEVGNIYVSAYQAVPWTSISDKIEPKLAMTTADAKLLATVTTQSQVNQVLSTMAAGLAIGLPTRSTSLTTAIAADGSQTTTGNKTLGPGTVPGTSGASGVAVTDASLAASLAAAPSSNGVNGLTQLMNTVGIYQLAQILDNQISKAVPLKGYKAYLVTFQVNVQPARRGLAYDANLNLTLMPSSWVKAVASSQELAERADALPPIMVYPLIISDAMESSSSAKSAETIRQAALALSGIVSNIGLSAGFNKAVDRLEALTGSDLNTLVTVGRVSDHTLHIKLGAAQQGTEEFALVPRTHNISVVVFVRASNDKKRYLDSLSAVAETKFVPVKPGAPIPQSSRMGQAGRTGLQQKVKSILEGYDFLFNPDCGAQDELAGDLLRELDRGNYTFVSKCVVAYKTGDLKSGTPRRVIDPPPVAASGVKGTTMTLFNLAGLSETGTPKALTLPEGIETGFATSEEVRLRRVVAALMTIQADSRFGKLTIPLSPFKSTIPEQPLIGQLSFLRDGKESSTVILRGGANLEAAALRPTLLLKKTTSDDPIILVPSSVAVDSSGSTVTMTFPAIASSNLMQVKKAQKTGEKDEKIPPAELAVSWKAVNEEDSSKLDDGGRYVLQMLSVDEPAMANPVTATSNVLIADAAGTATVTLVIGEWDDKRGVLGLRVSGAEVRAWAPAGVMDYKRNAIPVKGSSVVVLTLANLAPAQPVQIRTIADASPVGSALTLAVDLVRAAVK